MGEISGATHWHGLVIGTEGYLMAHALFAAEPAADAAVRRQFARIFTCENPLCFVLQGVAGALGNISVAAQPAAVPIDLKRLRG